MHRSGAPAAVPPEPAGALAEGGPNARAEAPCQGATAASTTTDVPGKQADSARRQATPGSGQSADKDKKQPQQDGAIDRLQAAVHPTDASRVAQQPEQQSAHVSTVTHGAVSCKEPQPDEVHAPARPAVPSQLSDTQSSSLAAPPAAEASPTNLDSDGKALSRDTADIGSAVQVAEEGDAAEAGTEDAQQFRSAGSSTAMAEDDSKSAATDAPEAGNAFGSPLRGRDMAQRPLDTSSTCLAEPAAATDGKQLPASITAEAEARGGATASKQEANVGPAPGAHALAAHVQKGPALQSPAAAPGNGAVIPAQQSSAPIKAHALAPSAGEERGASAQPASPSAAAFPAGISTAPVQPETAQAPADGAFTDPSQPQEQSAVITLPSLRGHSPPDGQHDVTAGGKQSTKASQPPAQPAVASLPQLAAHSLPSGQHSTTAGAKEPAEAAPPRRLAPGP